MVDSAQVAQAVAGPLGPALGVTTDAAEYLHGIDELWH